jgi:hypothetical protein
LLKHREGVLLLFEFPGSYVDVGSNIDGAIDGVEWMTGNRSGAPGEPVPSGSPVFIRGWATDLAGTGPVEAIVLIVDGTEKFHARVSVPRPEVARSRADEGFAACGFEAVITTGRLTPGDHTIVAYSVDPEERRYARVAAESSFTVVADWRLLPDPTPVSEGGDGSLDEVKDESRGTRFTLDGKPLTVAQGTELALRGWFYEPSFVPDEVTAYAVVDGQRAFAGSYGTPRLDVGEQLGFTDVGFEVRIPTADLAPGRHEIRIVSAAGDAVVLMPIRVAILVGAMLPPQARLEQMTSAFIDEVIRIQPGSPRDLGAPLRLARGDRLFVRGWAIDDIAGSPAAGVFFSIDRQIDIAAIYGLPRGDVAAERGSELFRPTGFTAEIATDGLAEGHHSVSCYALAKDGSGAYATAQRFDFEVRDV